MSFQGTLDLFGLADILRLLSASGKDGLLALRRDGAAGGIWLVDGGVAWAATRSGPPWSRGWPARTPSRPGGRRPPGWSPPPRCWYRPPP